MVLAFVMDLLLSGAIFTELKLRFLYVRKNINLPSRVLSIARAR